MKLNISHEILESNDCGSEISTEDLGNFSKIDILGGGDNSVLKNSLFSFERH